MKQNCTNMAIDAFVLFACSGLPAATGNVIGVQVLSPEQIGGISILVNNAGVHLKKPTIETTESEMPRCLAHTLPERTPCAEPQFPEC